MKPINAAQRNATILRFSLCYILMILLVVFLFYFSLIEIPKKQSELTAITNEQVDKLIHHTNEADTLVIQIQKAADINAKALTPLFKWTGDLQAAYRQPFYQSIITSYVDLFNEINKSKMGDTTLVRLRSKMNALQKENLLLMEQNDKLEEDLTNAKLKRD